MFLDFQEAAATIRFLFHVFRYLSGGEARGCDDASLGFGASRQQSCFLIFERQQQPSCFCFMFWDLRVKVKEKDATTPFCHRLQWIQIVFVGLFYHSAPYLKLKSQYIPFWKKILRMPHFCPWTLPFKGRVDEGRIMAA